jgi:hypothetical protein
MPQQNEQIFARFLGFVASDAWQAADCLSSSLQIARAEVLEEKN